MVIIIFDKIKSIGSRILLFLKLRLDALMIIILIISVGIFCVYMYYSFFAVAVIKAPDTKDDKIFLNKDNYKFFQEKLGERKGVLDILKSTNFEDIFN